MSRYLFLALLSLLFATILESARISTDGQQNLESLHRLDRSRTLLPDKVTLDEGILERVLAALDPVPIAVAPTYGAAAPPPIYAPDLGGPPPVYGVLPPSPVPSPSVEESQSVTYSFDCDYAQFVDNPERKLKFEAQLKLEIASSLGISPSLVNVVSVLPGSTNAQVSLPVNSPFDQVQFSNDFRDTFGITSYTVAPTPTSTVVLFPPPVSEPSTSSPLEVSPEPLVVELLPPPPLLESSPPPSPDRGLPTTNPTIDNPNVPTMTFSPPPPSGGAFGLSANPVFLLITTAIAVTLLVLMS